jgi:hypothetical protein
MSKYANLSLTDIEIKLNTAEFLKHCPAFLYYGIVHYEFWEYKKISYLQQTAWTVLL